MNSKKQVVVRAVTTPRLMDDFIRLPQVLYKDSACYVPLPGIVERGDFNEAKNPSLQSCKVKLFTAYLDGECVGRVAGIINFRANSKWKQQAVRFSRIEFINDADVAEALLSAVEQWGRSEGMTEVYGPLGFNDFDKEGMLISDFDRPSSMNEIYNPPYYPTMIASLGYEKAADWVHIRVKVPTEVPDKYARVARLCRERYGLRVRKINNHDIIEGGYGRRIFQLLNDAYSPLFGFIEFTEAEITLFINEYIRIIDKQLITVVENAEGDIVGVAITMGSLTEGLRRAGGKLWPLGWLWLLRSLKFKHEDTVEMLLIAVRPDYQLKGVNALFFDDLIPIYISYGFKWAETGPQLETNVRELRQWDTLSPEFIKRRRCWKKHL
ncbi:MAG: N-acetyltransferase [Prevotella sp.]|nr:N-acetyltransferase [Prevotella sp.]